MTDAVEHAARAISLRVPSETAYAAFRVRQKRVEKTLGSILADLRKAHDHGAADLGAVRRQAAATIGVLQTAIDESAAVEQAALSRIITRASTDASSPAGLSRTAVARHYGRWPIDFAVVECLARNGYAEAATAVGGDFDDVRSSIAAIRGAEDRLRERDLQPALRWAVDNASRLRRIDSDLELQLRKQEFLELVRSGRVPESLEHANSFLAPAARAAAAAPDPAAESESGAGSGAGAGSSAAAAATAAGGAAAARALQQRPSSSAVPEDGRSTCTGRSRDEAQAPMQVLQSCMAVLAFPQPASCGVPAVEALFADAAWQRLADRFTADALAAAGFPHRPLLEHIVWTGTAALKTSKCEKCASGAGGSGGSSSGSAASGSSAQSSSRSSSSASTSAGESTSQARIPPLLPADWTRIGEVPPSMPPLASLGSSWDAPPTRAELAALAAASSASSALCPLCDTPYFSHVIPRVPRLSAGVSRLLDPLAGELINEDNPPLVLPDGHVLGSRTVELLATPLFHSGERAGDAAPATAAAASGGAGRQPAQIPSSSASSGSSPSGSPEIATRRGRGAGAGAGAAAATAAHPTHDSSIDGPAGPASVLGIQVVNPFTGERYPATAVRRAYFL